MCIYVTILVGFYLTKFNILLHVISHKYDCVVFCYSHLCVLLWKWFCCHSNIQTLFVYFLFIKHPYMYFRFIIIMEFCFLHNTLYTAALILVLLFVYLVFVHTLQYYHSNNSKLSLHSSQSDHCWYTNIIIYNTNLCINVYVTFSIINISDIMPINS